MSMQMLAASQQSNQTKKKMQAQIDTLSPAAKEAEELRDLV